jgi:hypothetical protein
MSNRRGGIDPDPSNRDNILSLSKSEKGNDKGATQDVEGVKAAKMIGISVTNPVRIRNRFLQATKATPAVLYLPVILMITETV